MLPEKHFQHLDRMCNILSATGGCDNTEEEVATLLEKLPHIRKWSGFTD